MKKQQKFIEKDCTISRAIVGFSGLAIIACLAIGFSNVTVLLAFGYIPNWVESICRK